MIRKRKRETTLNVEGRASYVNEYRSLNYHNLHEMLQAKTVFWVVTLDVRTI